MYLVLSEQVNVHFYFKEYLVYLVEKMVNNLESIFDGVLR